MSDTKTFIGMLIIILCCAQSVAITAREANQIASREHAAKIVQAKGELKARIYSQIKEQADMGFYGTTLEIPNLLIFADYQPLVDELKSKSFTVIIDDKEGPKFITVTWDLKGK